MSENSFLNNDARNELMSLEDQKAVTEDTVLEVLKKQFPGEEIPEIKVYNQNDFNIGQKSGLNVSAVHIYDEKTKVNEVYYLFRGTEPENFDDVWTDAAGIGAGSNSDQIKDSIKFNQAVEKQVKSYSKTDISKFADGYSLGGNNAVSTAIIDKSFKDVRTLNGAPLSGYQLTGADPDFKDYLAEKYRVADMHEISESKIVKEVKNYYGSQKHKVTHIRVKGEPLYVQSFPGKVYFGEKIITLGTRSGLEDFPDIGKYPAEIYTELPAMAPFLAFDHFRYNLGVKGILGGVRELDQSLGLESSADLFENSGDYFGKLPPYLRAGATVTGVVGGTGTFLTSPGLQRQVFIGIQKKGQVDLHYYHNFLEFYEKYYNAEMPLYMIADPVSGEEILLEPVALYRFIAQCQLGLELKQDVLKEFKLYKDKTTEELYKDQQANLRRQMSEKESNPQGFMSAAFSGGAYAYANGYDMIAESLSFNKDFASIRADVLQPLEEIIETLKSEILHLEDFIDKYSKTYQKMFEKDEELKAYIETLTG